MKIKLIKNKSVFEYFVIRFFDITLSIIGIIFFSPIFVLILFFGFFDTGKPLLFQKRVGYKLKIFNIIKFRSMKLSTVSKGTHLINKSKITRFGFILRKTKLDEMPQLFNVLIGEMSIVGPRPCLPNQARLISLRKKKGIFNVLPGITGLSQINNIDMSSPKKLVSSDYQMIKNLNLIRYLYYIIFTLINIKKNFYIK